MLSDHQYQREDVAVTFTADSEVLELPPVPYKEGYTIVGWDITEFPKGDVTIRAIYQKAE